MNSFHVPISYNADTKTYVMSDMTYEQLLKSDTTSDNQTLVHTYKQFEHMISDDKPDMLIPITSFISGVGKTKSVHNVALSKNAISKDDAEMDRLQNIIESDNAKLKLLYKRRDELIEILK